MQESTYMSDIEREKVIAFNNDPVLKEAVRKVLLAFIYENGTLQPGKAAFDPKKNFALGMASDPNKTDAEVGNALKVAVSAIMRVEEAWKSLENYKPVKKAEEGPKVNPGE